MERDIIKVLWRRNLTLHQFLQLEDSIPVSAGATGFQFFLKQGIGQF